MLDDALSDLPPIESRPCFICGETESRVLYHHALAPVSRVSLHGGYRVSACVRCGAIFAKDIPSQEAFDRYYGELSKYEDGSNLGAPSPIDQVRFAAIADELAKVHKDLDQRILEVGCSTGGLLGALMTKGFRRLHGVDPSGPCSQAAKALYGAEVHRGTLFDPYPEAPYDGIIAIGVLEHVRDLKRAVIRIREAVADGGWIYLEVPDLEGFPSSDEAPFQEFSTEHINFFTTRSLRSFMGLHGFSPAWGGAVQRRHSGGSNMQVLGMGFKKTQFEIPISVRDETGQQAVLEYVRISEERAEPEKELMSRLAASPTPLAVWGAGTLACRLMASTDLAKAPIAAFVDTNPHLQGQTLGGLPIHPPEWLRDFEGTIFVASRGYASSIERMVRESMGLGNPLVKLEP